MPFLVWRNDVGKNIYILIWILLEECFLFNLVHVRWNICADWVIFRCYNNMLVGRTFLGITFKRKESHRSGHR